MGLSSLPAPSEGMLCILLVNTALSISIFKGIVRSILHVVGIRLSSSPSPSLTSSENPSEPFDFRFCHADSFLEEFRKRTPTLRFGSLRSCEKQPEAEHEHEHEHEHVHDHECSVCLTKFESESEISKLNCGHLFHETCLEKWIDYWNMTCPLCRAPLVPEEEVSSCIW